MRFLGKTELKVSELCLGTSTFGGVGLYKKAGDIGQKEANSIINIALDSGINFFNTAEVYSNGMAEEILGKALGTRRKEAIVITKIHPTRSPGPNDGGFSRKHLIECCEASLNRLKTDYIDIYQLHMFDEYTPLEITLQTLNDLVRSGKVRYIGCSGFTGWQVMKCIALARENRWENFMTIEVMYSLISRWVELELVPLCLDQKIGLLAFAPLHGGYLTGKYRRGQPWPTGTRFDKPLDTGPYPVEQKKLFDIVEELERIANSHNVIISQVAMNYLLRKPAVTSLVFGIRNLQQLEENIKATDWEMSPEEVKRLDKISGLKRRYPYYVFNPVSEPAH